MELIPLLCYVYLCWNAFRERFEQTDLKLALGGGWAPHALLLARSLSAGTSLVWWFGAGVILYGAGIYMRDDLILAGLLVAGLGLDVLAVFSILEVMHRAAILKKDTVDSSSPHFYRIFLPSASMTGGLGLTRDFQDKLRKTPIPNVFEISAASLDAAKRFCPELAEIPVWRDFFKKVDNYIEDLKINLLNQQKTSLETGMIATEQKEALRMANDRVEELEKQVSGLIEGQKKLQSRSRNDTAKPIEQQGLAELETTRRDLTTRVRQVNDLIQQKAKVQRTTSSVPLSDES